MKHSLKKKGVERDADRNSQDKFYRKHEIENSSNHMVFLLSKNKPKEHKRALLGKRVEVKWRERDRRDLGLVTRLQINKMLVCRSLGESE